MQVVISRHPSLQDLKYINDVSSVLAIPSIFISNKEEPIYQELIQVDHSIDIDENKENRPPLIPIKYQNSRIPVWTPSPTSKIINTPGTTFKNNKKHEEVKNKPMTTTTKSCLTGKYI